MARTILTTSLTEFSKKQGWAAGGTPSKQLRKERRDIWHAACTDDLDALVSEVRELNAEGEGVTTRGDLKREGVEAIRHLDFASKRYPDRAKEILTLKLEIGEKIFGLTEEDIQTLTRGRKAPKEATS